MIDVDIQQIKEDSISQKFTGLQGSALNNRGEVEMYALMMDVKTLKAGADSITKKGKNLLTLARLVMKHNKLCNALW